MRKEKKKKESKKERVKQSQERTWRGRKEKGMQKVCSHIFSERKSSFSLDL